MRFVGFWELIRYHCTQLGDMRLRSVLLNQTGKKMKHAETVTFGGSGLDRAAELRGDAAALAALKSDPETRAVLYWRGKLLLSGSDRDTLARLPLNHPVLADASPERLFLGRDLLYPAIC